MCDEMIRKVRSGMIDNVDNDVACGDMKCDCNTKIIDI